MYHVTASVTRITLFTHRRSEQGRTYGAQHLGSTGTLIMSHTVTVARLATRVASLPQEIMSSDVPCTSHTPRQDLSQDLSPPGPNDLSIHPYQTRGRTYQTQRSSQQARVPSTHDSTTECTLECTSAVLPTSRAMERLVGALFALGAWCLWRQVDLAEVQNYVM